MEEPHLGGEDMYDPLGGTHSVMGDVLSSLKDERAQEPVMLIARNRKPSHTGSNICIYGSSTCVFQGHSAGLDLDM